MSSNYVTQKLAVELLSPYLDILVNETRHDSKYWPIQKYPPSVMKQARLCVL